MLRQIRKTVRSAMAALCLVSSLTLAQTPPQTLPQSQPQLLTCSKDDSKGDCVAAKTPDGKEIVVIGKGMQKGAAMACVNTGNRVSCTPATK